MKTIGSFRENVQKVGRLNEIIKDPVMQEAIEVILSRSRLLLHSKPNELSPAEAYYYTQGYDRAIQDFLSMTIPYQEKKDISKDMFAPEDADKK